MSFHVTIYPVCIFNMNDGRSFGLLCFAMEKSDCVITAFVSRKLFLTFSNAWKYIKVSVMVLIFFNFECKLLYFCWENYAYSLLRFCVTARSSSVLKSLILLLKFSWQPKHRGYILTMWQFVRILSATQWAFSSIETAPDLNRNYSVTNF